MQMDFRRSRPTRSLALSWLLIGLLAAGSGCAHAQPRPNLGAIYDEAAQAPDYLRNPVVVIPGVLGSRLVDDETGKIVWGKFDAFVLFRRASADTVAIALPMMPAIYQLLPRPRHGALVDANDTGRKLDVYDPALWRDMQWGLADPKQDDVLQKLLPGVKDRAARLRIALDHQRKCLRKARQLHRALDVPAVPPPGVTLHLFAGDAIETPAVEAVDLQSGEIHAVRSSPGDDSTTRTSAA